MKVGIPKEVHSNELRVAATPATVQKLVKRGIEVIVQAGAGTGASAVDGAYAEAGAHIVPDAATVWSDSDLVLKVRAPMFVEATGKHEADLLKEGAALVSFVWPAQNAPLLQRLAARKATVLAMDAVPRITRAQKLDALSAMANIAGYRAVIEAASHYGRLLGGQITAAGRVKPARVFIIGAGVAGLAAVGAAKSLGAVVRAFDTRNAVREQVESMGGKFVPFEYKESGEGEGGYAKQMSEAYLAAEQAMLAKECENSDIVITTALIPGVEAPKLVTSGAVVSMHHGSVIIDLAAEQGGNCALTEPDRVVERFGVTIVGLTNLTSKMAVQASELYAATVFNLLEEVLDKDNAVAIDLDDEVGRSVLVVNKGEVSWPPPKRPILRSGAPRPEARNELQRAPEKAAPPSAWRGRFGMLAGAGLLSLLGVYAPTDFLQHFTVFLLACVVGWHVIWNVTPALHTPLMSVTNAISGIILIGGMLLMGGAGIGVTTALAAVAVLVATINVSGGFLVTQRMLKMFRK